MVAMNLFTVGITYCGQSLSLAVLSEDVPSVGQVRFDKISVRIALRLHMAMLCGVVN